MNLKNYKKDKKKKNLLATVSSNQVKIRSDVEENIVYTSMKKEVNLSILHHQEYKEITKLFHIKNRVKKTKIDDMFDSGSQANLIVTDLVKNIGLEVQGHPIPYPLGWVNKDANIKVMKHCKIKFYISFDIIDEVELYIVCCDVCGVMFGNPCMYMRDEIFMQRDNQYRMIKDGKYFIINSHKGKSKISILTFNQAKKLISYSNKYDFLFLR